MGEMVLVFLERSERRDQGLAWIRLAFDGEFLLQRGFQGEVERCKTGKGCAEVERREVIVFRERWECCGCRRGSGSVGGGVVRHRCRRGNCGS